MITVTVCRLIELAYKTTSTPANIIIWVDTEMEIISTTKVFGVSKDKVLSYINREEVDGEFEKALESDRHIIIYGSSKQGKSALVQTHILKENSITIGCSPKMGTKEIYSSLLRQAGIRFERVTEDTEGTSTELSIKSIFKAIIPVFGEAGADVGASSRETSERTVTCETIEFNLEVAQDISELLNEVKFDKYIVLENFHYLSEETQKSLAFDLRLFQENGYRFVIVGIWRERNRLNQFNGDLVDRIIEIPVEPWNDPEFDLVIRNGCNELNILLSSDIVSEIKEYSYGNIGIVQELCKEVCLIAGINEKQKTLKCINDKESLNKAVSKKADEYSSRHIRSLESIAASGASNHGLYMPYYLVRTIISSRFEDLKEGIRRQDLQASIKRIHYRANDVRASDMSYLLHGLSELQHKKEINPPLFDYDLSSQRIRIIDSTVFFFLNFMNKDEILEEIPDPTEIILNPTANNS